MREIRLTTIRSAACFAAGILLIGSTIPALAQNATRTLLSAAPSPSQIGQNVTLTADVDALGGFAPTGLVTFYDGAASLGTAVLLYAGAGQATISGGDRFNCALTNASGLKCWGWNDFGQLGDGTHILRTTPVNVNGLAGGVTAVDAGIAHTCALTKAGAVKCWGYNGEGEVGDGTNQTRNVPVAVSGFSGAVVSVSAGGNHSCAATRNGAASCWGWNRDGQIGDGTFNNNRLTPQAVSGLSSRVVTVAAGAIHSCALLSKGKVKCWGSNGFSQLGDGTGTSRLTPVAVTGLPGGVVALSSSNGHTTCAIDGPGGLWCWGRNWYGGLGDGTTFNRNTATAVAGLSSGVAAVAPGLDHTCAVTTTGKVRCWGRNDFGQLGDGTTTNRLTPVAVIGLAGKAVAVAVGAYHSCALLRAGSVKCWGFNAEGQIGDGTTVNRLTPASTSSLATLARSRASFSTTTLAAGVHTLKATYPGDTTHSGSTRDLSHTVN